MVARGIRWLVRDRMVLSILKLEIIFCKMVSVMGWRF